MVEAQGSVLEQAASAVEADNQAKPDSNDSIEASQDDVAENPYKGTKHKIKVDKSEEEHDYDEVLRLASHGKAASKRMQEAAEEKKLLAKERESVKEEIETLRTTNKTFSNALISLQENPDNLLELGKELGINFDKWAHEHVVKQMQYANMSDVEKRAHDLGRENAELKKQQDAYKRRQEDEQYKRHEESTRSQLFSEMNDYLSKRGVEKPDADLVTRAIEIMKDTKSTQQGRWPFSKAYEYAEGEFNQKRASFDRNYVKELIRKGELDADEIKLFRELEMRSARKKPMRQSTSEQRPSKSKEYKTIEQAFRELP